MFQGSWNESLLALTFPSSGPLPYPLNSPPISLLPHDSPLSHAACAMQPSNLQPQSPKTLLTQKQYSSTVLKFSWTRGASDFLWKRYWLEKMLIWWNQDIPQNHFYFGFFFTKEKNQETFQPETSLVSWQLIYPAHWQLIRWRGIQHLQFITQMEPGDLRFPTDHWKALQ